MSAKTQAGEPRLPRSALAGLGVQTHTPGALASFKTFFVTELKLRWRQPQLPLTLVLFALLTAAYLPEEGASYVTLTVGGQRGVYNPAWVGLVTALFGALIFSLPAFWMVRGLIDRDVRRGTWDLLSSSGVPLQPLLLARWASNTVYLCGLWAAVVLTSLPLLLIRSEAPGAQWWGLGTAFLTLTVPTLALVSAAATAGESLKRLRGGLGSALWVGLWLCLVIGVLSNQPVLDPTGVNAALQQVWTQMSGQPTLKGAEISLGFKPTEQPTAHFIWNGLQFTGAFLITRLAWVLGAAALVVLSARFFQEPASALVGMGKVQEPRRRRFTRLSRFLPALSSLEWSLAWQAVPLWWKLGGVGLWAAGALTDHKALPLLVALPALTTLVALSREARLDELLRTTGVTARLHASRFMLGLVCVLLPMTGIVFRTQSAADLLTVLSSATLLTGLAALLHRVGLRPMSSQLLLLTLWYVGPFQHTPVLDILQPGRWPGVLLTGLLLMALSLWPARNQRQQ